MTEAVQAVSLVVIRELPRFQRRREGSFRAWLRKVTVNQVRTHAIAPEQSIDVRRADIGADIYCSAVILGKTNAAESSLYLSRGLRP